MAKQSKNGKYIGCSVKELPQKELYAASQLAISINPANRPPEAMMAKIGTPTDKLAIAVLSSKFLGSEGVKWRVGFMSRASAALQDKILSHFNAWAEYCNTTFEITSGAVSSAEIRISLGGSGYWSFLGSDVLHIPKNQPTMNLQGFSLNTSEAEYRRVVRHEVGHSIGCPHEHMRKSIVNRLDEAKTISYFQRTQGWSAQETQQQVLTPLEDSSIMGTTTAEDTSVMCYGLPASITRDGRPIVGGTDITVTDAAFMGKLYPKTIVQPPDPPTAFIMTLVFSQDPSTGTYTATLRDDGPPPTP